ncbi:MAG: DUF364 domain-containing protein [Promethearchaeia archaeon]
MSNFIKKTKVVLEKKMEGKDFPETTSVLIGRKYLAVLLEEILGVCFGPRSESSKCNVFTNPGELCRMDASELLNYVESDNLIEKGIGIATMNALSQFYIQENPKEYNKYNNLDTLKLLPLQKDRKVGMVGRIRPFVKLLVKRSANLIIVDDNPSLSTGKPQDGLIITRDIDDLQDIDILIVTGSTVVEHTVEKPLEVAKDAIFKIIIGPTSSWIPDVAFELALDAVAGMEFKDSESAFRTIMEGGGTRNFGKYANKYILTKEPPASY